MHSPAPFCRDPSRVDISFHPWTQGLGSSPRSCPFRETGFRKTTDLARAASPLGTRPLNVGASGVPPRHPGFHRQQGLGVVGKHQTPKSTSEPYSWAPSFTPCTTRSLGPERCRSCPTWNLSAMLTTAIRGLSPGPGGHCILVAPRVRAAPRAGDR